MRPQNPTRAPYSRRCTRLLTPLPQRQQVVTRWCKEMKPLGYWMSITCAHGGTPSLLNPKRILKDVPASIKEHSLTSPAATNSGTITWRKQDFMSSSLTYWRRQSILKWWMNYMSVLWSTCMLCQRFGSITLNSYPGSNSWQGHARHTIVLFRVCLRPSIVLSGFDTSTGLRLLPKSTLKPP